MKGDSKRQRDVTVPSDNANQEARKTDSILSDGGKKVWRERWEEWKEKGLSYFARSEREDHDFETASEAFGFAETALDDAKERSEVQRRQRDELEEELGEQLAPVIGAVSDDIERLEQDPELEWGYTPRDSDFIPDDEDQGFNFTGETFLGYVNSGTRRINNLDEDINRYEGKLDDIREDVEEHEEEMESLEGTREERLGRINESSYDAHESARDIANKRNRAEQRREEEEMLEKMEGDQGEQFVDLLDRLHEAEGAKERIIEGQEQAYGEMVSEARDFFSEAEQELSELFHEFDSYESFGDHLEDVELSAEIPLGVDSGIPELKKNMNIAASGYAMRAAEVVLEMERATETVRTIEDALYEEVNEDVATDLEQKMDEMAGDYYELRDRVDDMYGGVVDISTYDAIAREGFELEQMREEEKQKDGL